MFVLRNAEGKIIAGDSRLDDVLREHADETGSTIEDEETGEVVYPLPE